MSCMSVGHVNRARRVIVALAAMLALVQCTGGTEPTPNPPPVLLSANPTSLVAGTTSATLTVTGEAFVATSRARWNGADRPTTFVSLTQLSVQLTAQDLATAGSGSLTVYNPPPGGGVSGVLAVPILTPNPVPVVTQLLPANAYAGSALSLLVIGASFIPSSVVRWNGVDRPTTYLDEDALVARISAADLAAPGSANVTVHTPAPGGGTSTPRSLPILAVPAATHPTGNFFVAYGISGRPHGVTVAPSGRFLVSLIDGNAVRRGTVDPNDQSFSPSPITVGSTPAHVAIDPSGPRAYTANQFGMSVSVVDAEVGTLITTIPIGEQAFNVLVAPSGNRLYVSTEAGHLLVIDTGNLSTIASIPVGGAANGIALDPAIGRLYVSSIFAGTITAIDLATNTVVRTYTVSGQPQRLALSPDGRELYIASEAAGLEILDLAAGTRSTVPGVDPGAVGLAISPDGAQLYVTNPPAGRVIVVDRAARQVVRSLTSAGRPRNVAFAAHGTTAIVTDEMGRVLFIR